MGPLTAVNLPIFQMLARRIIVSNLILLRLELFGHLVNILLMNKRLRI